MWSLLGAPPLGAWNGALTFPFRVFRYPLSLRRGKAPQLRRSSREHEPIEATRTSSLRSARINGDPPKSPLLDSLEVLGAIPGPLAVNAG